MRSFSVPALFLAVCCLASPLAAQLPVIDVYSGSTSNAWLGVSVAAAGDVNADGVPDTIAGAWSADPNGEDSGLARVFSGADGSVLFTFNGDGAYDRFGWSVAGVGDLNNDGHDDVAVGAPYDDNAGSNSGIVRIFSGANGGVIRTINGYQSQSKFGFSVASAGDVNGDGTPDVIAGANEAGFAGNDSGSIRVYSGTNGAILYTRNGSAAFDRFGSSVGSMGDMNGDGRSEFFVGAPGAGGTGQARIYSGSNGAVLFTFSGDGINDQFGEAAAAAGDVNADGVMDLIVGAYRDDNSGFDSGSARVFSGANGAVLYTFNADSPLDRFGISVSAAGDMNDDGFDDVIVGAPQDDNTGTNSGSARVFSGADGSVLVTWNGVGTGAGFGWAMASLGDCNGDGLPDVVVGAPTDSTFGNAFGTAKIMTLCGVRSYDAAGASNAMDLDWLPGFGGSATQGTFEAQGGPAGMPGFFGVSSGDVSAPLSGGVLLIDPTPGNYFLIPSAFDAAGRMPFPGTISLGIPGLKGVLFYMQAVGLQGSAVSLSNGLEILVGG